MDKYSYCDQYIKIISNDFKGLNLTSYDKKEDILNNFFIDCEKGLLVDGLGKLLEKRNILVDVGFGSGFPLLVLAYCFPNKRIIGIDSRKKKVDAVKYIASCLGFKNISVFHKRLENVYFDENVALFFKAVGTVDKMSNLTFCSRDTPLIFYKGANFFEKENRPKDKDLLICEEYYLQNKKRFIVAINKKKGHKPVGSELLSNLISKK